jgi:hypothetical protein
MLIKTIKEIIIKKKYSKVKTSGILCSQCICLPLCRNVPPAGVTISGSKNIGCTSTNGQNYIFKPFNIKQTLEKL